MLVGVTGGTGFVGAHSVAAIVRRGHRVRLLVRDESAVDPALGRLGVDGGAVDVHVGDVTDSAAVRRTVRRVDAVLHAASVYSFDSRQRARILATNVRGTELVLDAARRARVERIVYVSSVVAMFPARRRTIRSDSPVGRPREAYMASKAAAEVIARRHQAEGVGVVITYPPALLGPHDPHLGDQTARVRDVLRGLLPVWPLGGFPVGDVRDAAALNALLCSSPGTGPGRCFAPGRYLSTRQYLQVVREVTGRRLPTVFLPATAMVPLGLLAGAVQRVWPWHIPVGYGAIYTCACATRVEDNQDTHGIASRPVSESMLDTVRWLYQNGHLTARQAGAVAGWMGRDGR